MQFRKVCNHPFLFAEPPAYDDWDDSGAAMKDKAMLLAASGKMQMLDRMLPSLRKKGHRPVRLRLHEARFVVLARASAPPSRAARSIRPQSLNFRQTSNTHIHT